MPSENALTAWSPYALAALRIMSALLFIAHGTMVVQQLFTASDHEVIVTAEMRVERRDLLFAFGDENSGHGEIESVNAFVVRTEK